MSSTNTANTMININALADGIYDSLMCDDIPRAMHLSWHLMQQPYCPLQLQAQAVLVHSAASLKLGGDPRVIEGNMQSMIKRLSTILSKAPPPIQSDPLLLRTLADLRVAASSLRSHPSTLLHSKSKSKSYHPYAARLNPSKQKAKSSLLDLDNLVEGFGKLGLGKGLGRCGSGIRMMREEVMIIREEDHEDDHHWGCA
ncbi:hypothetical protein M422DRAFT_24667 [Sphaerobolus stellatus SS14]|nr:hypothetical protein M422DRAFT_24667 [Sphaerobolus stellatus SS14]